MSYFLQALAAILSGLSLEDRCMVGDGNERRVADDVTAFFCMCKKLQSIHVFTYVIV